MNISFVSSVEKIGKDRWNAITGIHNPFLRFEFMSALESNECVGINQGWLPHHLIIEEEQGGKLLGLMPLYLKDNSYGELVFDWAWADAYHQIGRQYYPKLVSAIPYTPVTSQRFFISQDQDESKIKLVLIDAIKVFADENKLSSIHCLFPPEDNCSSFEEKGFVSRLGCQFHWHNKQYDSFDHFISTFSSRKRKNISKERKKCHDQNISFEVITGDQVAPDLWPTIYHFYVKTFVEKGGYATFTQAFFEEISVTMGEQLMIVLAVYKGEYVACALSYCNDGSLFGRHWGCTASFDSLHFETCYYQGIDYAIENELTLFEPGAQGEHKISRGFVPTKTWSTHWIREEDFKGLIYDFVEKEKSYMKQYISDLEKRLPYKKSTN